MGTKKYVLVRLICFVLKEHFFCILSMLTRLVGLISAKTIAYFFGLPFMQFGLYIYQFILLHVTAYFKKSIFFRFSPKAKIRPSGAAVITGTRPNLATVFPVKQLSVVN